jgi:hypothetical protein
MLKVANTHHIIDKTQNVIYQVLAGEISVETAIKSSKNIVSDPDFVKKKFDVFADLSKAWPTFNMDIRSIGESIQFYSELEQMYDGRKWAIYAPEDYQYSFIKIFVKLLHNKHVDIKIFRDDIAAKKWLGIMV